MSSWRALSTKPPHFASWDWRIEGHREARAVARTLYEYWVEKGWEEGWLEGQRYLVRLLLEQCFGPLSLLARERLESWPEERLLELARTLHLATSLRELGLED